MRFFFSLIKRKQMMWLDEKFTLTPTAIGIQKIPCCVYGLRKSFENDQNNIEVGEDVVKTNEWWVTGNEAQCRWRYWKSSSALCYLAAVLTALGLSNSLTNREAMRWAVDWAHPRIWHLPNLCVRHAAVIRDGPNYAASSSLRCGRDFWRHY